MAKKKSHTGVEVIGETVSDIVDAASVAATGSQVGVLELAAEKELNPPSAKRKRKAKVAQKKKTALMKSEKKTKGHLEK